MIRLIEQQRKGRTIRGRLEGHLGQGELDILKKTLEQYRREGIEEVYLSLDGFSPSDPMTCVELRCTGSA